MLDMDFNDMSAESISGLLDLDLELNPDSHLQNGTSQVLHANQACNECKRRKGKCDRVAPECGSCSRFHRHCLYGSIGKTPLTRKHLTDVEHRLAAANLEIRNLRRTLRQYKEGGLELNGTHAEAAMLMEVKSAEKSPEVMSSALPVVVTHNSDLEVSTTSADSLEAEALGGLENPSSLRQPLQQTDPSQTPLADLPTNDYDFDWNEHSISTIVELNTSLGLSEDAEFIDGMASLSVDEKDVGYLGVASGAALLRILRPSKQETFSDITQERINSPSSFLYPQPDAHVHILDAMIDGYFRTYHLSYPIVHEPMFRAQYSGVIQSPSNTSWQALIYIIAALGAFSTASDHNSADVNLFHAARSNLSIDDLQSGNVTLVQTLTLMANYLQKRNKPNSGYNYLGLALHMAMGLGLHKEFPGWDIKPLQMEIRRRVWWTLFVFHVGATITFSRPLSWPSKGIDVKLPLNIKDRDLTATTTGYPNECAYPTTYSAVRSQVAFHLATNSIYTRVISIPFPSPKDVLDLDETNIIPWLQSLPSWYRETANVPPQYALGHAIMMWRYRNLRLIMYRPFVIRQSLRFRANTKSLAVSADEQEAYKRCLNEASESIRMIENFWLAQPLPHTKLCAWYALYFLFQASLVPIICLRNDPLAPASNNWRQDIRAAMGVIGSMSGINASSMKCMNTINNLCGEYLINTPTMTLLLNPTDDSPQTQISNVYPMMWPNVPDLEADVLMQDDTWLKFLNEAPLDGFQVMEYTDASNQWST